MKFYRDWRRDFSQRKRFCTHERAPFFELAAAWVKQGLEMRVVDVGAGTLDFAELVMKRNPLVDLVLLDQNDRNIETLRARGFKAQHYRAPGILALEDRSVSLIHCSHLLEHLNADDVYKTLQEFDRTLAIGGHLVISGPLLWDGFYDNLSHVKPYAPRVFTAYLCGRGGVRSKERVSNSYSIEEQVYRYTKRTDRDWGSSNACIDFMLYALTKSHQAIGFCRYVRSGFTIVLRKQ